MFAPVFLFFLSLGCREKQALSGQRGQGLELVPRPRGGQDALHGRGLHQDEDEEHTPGVTRLVVWTYDGGETTCICKSQNTKARASFFLYCDTVLVHCNL